MASFLMKMMTWSPMFHVKHFERLSCGSKMFHVKQFAKLPKILLKKLLL